MEDCAAPTYSVVIPCYRSGDWLDRPVELVCKTMDVVAQSYEALLVNDASPDDTWLQIESIATKHPQVRAIDLMFNTGQFRTNMCGRRHAYGDYIILLDDDFQNPPKEMPKLIEAMKISPELDCSYG